MDGEPIWILNLGFFHRIIIAQPKSPLGLAELVTNMVGVGLLLRCFAILEEAEDDEDDKGKGEGRHEAKANGKSLLGLLVDGSQVVRVSCEDRRGEQQRGSHWRNSKCFSDSSSSRASLNDRRIIPLGRGRLARDGPIDWTKYMVSWTQSLGIVGT